jgi:hypothetical protein
MNGRTVEVCNGQFWYQLFPDSDSTEAPELPLVKLDAVLLAYQVTEEVTDPNLLMAAVLNASRGDALGTK